MPKDLLFLDKDETLGHFVDGRSLYPGTEAFLIGELAQGRELHVVTTAGERGKRNISQIEHLLSGYWSRTFFSDIENIHYYRPDGTIGNIREEHTRGRYILPNANELVAQENRYRDECLELTARLQTTTQTETVRALNEELSRISREWSDLNERLDWLYHKETLAPLDKHRTCRSSTPKDFRLLKQLIDPAEYAQTRAVMIGNYKDIPFMLSDTSVPIIVVEPKTAHDTTWIPNWERAAYVTSALFAQGATPKDAFDELYAQGKQTSYQKERGCRSWHTSVGTILLQRKDCSEGWVLADPIVRVAYLAARR